MIVIQCLLMSQFQKCISYSYGTLLSSAVMSFFLDLQNFNFCLFTLINQSAVAQLQWEDKIILKYVV